MKHRFASSSPAMVAVFAATFPAAAQEKIDKDIQWKIRREATDNSQIMRTHALPDGRVWTAAHRLAEPEGGAGLDRQGNDAVGIEERAPRAVVVRTSRAG